MLFKTKLLNLHTDRDIVLQLEATVGATGPQAASVEVNVGFEPVPVYARVNGCVKDQNLKGEAVQEYAEPKAKLINFVIMYKLIIYNIKTYEIKLYFVQLLIYRGRYI